MNAITKLKTIFKDTKDLVSYYIDQSYIDENAETLKDKLRDEHRPTLEELDSIVENRPQP